MHIKHEDHRWEILTLFIGMPIKGISLKIAFDKLGIKRFKKYTVMTWYKNNDLLDL